MNITTKSANKVEKPLKIAKASDGNEPGELQSAGEDKMMAGE